MSWGLWLNFFYEIGWFKVSKAESDWENIPTILTFNKIGTFKKGWFFSRRVILSEKSHHLMKFPGNY